MSFPVPFYGGEAALAAKRRAFPLGEGGLKIADKGIVLRRMWDGVHYGFANC